MSGLLRIGACVFPALTPFCCGEVLAEAAGEPPAESVTVLQGVGPTSPLDASISLLENSVQQDVDVRAAPVDVLSPECVLCPHRLPDFDGDSDGDGVIALGDFSQWSKGRSLESLSDLAALRPDPLLDVGGPHGELFVAATLAPPSAPETAGPSSWLLLGAGGVIGFGAVLAWGVAKP